MTDKNEKYEKILLLAIMKEILNSSKDDKECQEKMKNLAAELMKAAKEREIELKTKRLEEEELREEPDRLIIVNERDVYSGIPTVIYTDQKEYLDNSFGLIITYIKTDINNSQVYKFDFLDSNNKSIYNYILKFKNNYELMEKVINIKKNCKNDLVILKF